MEIKNLRNLSLLLINNIELRLLNMLVSFTSPTPSENRGSIVGSEATHAFLIVVWNHEGVSTTVILFICLSQVLK